MNDDERKVAFRDQTAGVKAGIVVATVIAAVGLSIVLAILIGLGVRLVGWVWS